MKRRVFWTSRQLYNSFQIYIKVFLKIMQPEDKQQFLTKFYQFANPMPLETRFTEQELKNNDMKISLQIATQSNLRMQSDTKTHLVSFSCKKYGKGCFQIFAVKKQDHYQIETNYKQVKHQRYCELHKESFQYLKIYNLMKLKKNLIQDFMIKRNLFHSSPSQILSQISQQGEYFFEKSINYNPQLRRKLRKRFDNIINIDIKKITKGGRDQNEQGDREIFRQKKNEQDKKDNSSFSIDIQEFYVHKKIKNNKVKKIKKKQQKKKVEYLRLFNPRRRQKQNIQIQKKQVIPSRQSQARIQSQIYINPASQQQLKQIKELKESFNRYEDIFSWQEDHEFEPIYSQTINDKLRENVFMSLRNSIMKKSLQTQSISNFAQNIGNLNDFNEEEQIM